MHPARAPSRVRSPLDRLGLNAAPSPGILQIIDALILFDTPLLDQRFQEAIAMHPDAEVRKALEALPPRVAKGSRLTRRAGTEWERVAYGKGLDDAFRNRAERFLLEAFLDAAEQQIRLKSFMSGYAPTREVRELIEDAIDIHRELAEALRKAVSALEEGDPNERHPPDAAYIGPDDQEGDLRLQVEAAVRSMAASRSKPKLLVVSSNAMRHLRDQGLFSDGATDVMGVPVQVDFSWGDRHFALLSFDSAALDEIVKR